MHEKEPDDRRDASRRGSSPLGDALRWAIETGDGAMSAADWLARDLQPTARGAVELLTDPLTPLDVLREAKEAFKTMRLVGERAADRRLGGSLYLAAIAAGIAYHGARISTQDDANVQRALERLAADEDQPEPIRGVARAALRTIAAPPVRPRDGTLPA